MSAVRGQSVRDSHHDGALQRDAGHDIGQRCIKNTNDLFSVFLMLIIDGRLFDRVYIFVARLRVVVESAEVCRRRRRCRCRLSLCLCRVWSTRHIEHCSTLLLRFHDSEFERRRVLCVLRKADDAAHRQAARSVVLPRAGQRTKSKRKFVKIRRSLLFLTTTMLSRRFLVCSQRQCPTPDVTLYVGIAIAALVQ